MALYQVVSGNQILAADLNQYYNLLTGAITSEQVILAGGLQLKGTGAQILLVETGTSTAKYVEAIPAGANSALRFMNNAYSTPLMQLYDSGALWVGPAPVDAGAAGITTTGRVQAGAGALNASVPAPEVVAWASGTPGEVSLHFYNGGGVTEWRWRQPAHATGDWADFGSQSAGTFTQMLRVYPSGGLYLGTTPADPGANNLSVKGVIQSQYLSQYADGGVSIGATPADPGSYSLQVEKYLTSGTYDLISLLGTVEPGSTPQLSVVGGDTNINISIVPKGAGVVDFHYAPTSGNTSAQAGYKLPIQVNGTTYYLQLYSS